jgi:hypothetical protein
MRSILSRSRTSRLKQGIKSRIGRIVLNALKMPEVEAQIWESVHRPKTRHAAQDIRAHLYWQAAKEAADYVKRHMLQSKPYETHFELLEVALAQARLRGLYLEFGVASGRSINFIAQHVPQTVHGFDSFRGLPEDWIESEGKGTYDRHGKPPAVRENVALHPGWFEETLPAFAAGHEEPVAFMNIDCDLYSSTKTIFDVLGDRIIAGTVIRFGEYFNYPGWQDHEYKAFQEFVEQRRLAYQYIGYTRRNYSVAVVVKGPRGA